MIKLYVISGLLLIPLLGFAQLNDTTTNPIISLEKGKLLKNINIGFDMRTEFQAYTFRGGDQYYNGVQFENGYTALSISGSFHERVKFNFRNRFNRRTQLQSLDLLGSNIELAYMQIKANQKLDVFVGKMPAFYGGYEYEFSPLNILEYNDIYSNVLAFVTGAGITYQALEDHQFGVQVLNSRTLLYEDLYGDVITEGIEEPIWPVAVVGNWRGNFFDGKLQTIYSASFSNEVKQKGTYFFTLGHKYQNQDLTLMYDFQYSYEEVDTKGIVNNLLEDNQVAQDVTYIENWLRAEYRFSPKFQGLLTLMTSTAYDDVNRNQEHIRTSYGAIPTLYYRPFKNIDVRIFLAYLGRYFDYSDYAIENYEVSSYNKNEVRVGVIAPLLLL